MNLAPLFLLSALFAFPDGSAPEEGQDAESLLVRYDLTAVLPRFDAGTGWEQSLVQAPTSWADLPRVSTSELHEDAAPDQILDLVTQVLGDDLRYEGRQIALEDETMLVVLAPDGVQAKVRRVLDVLSSAFGAAVSVRVDVVTLPSGSGESVGRNIVANAEADRLISALVARGATHRQHVLPISAGRTSMLDQTTSVPFLYDYDVEIAQSAFIWDPIAVDISEGLRLYARGVPTPAGMQLAVLFHDAELLHDVRDKPINLRGFISDEQKGGFSYAEGPQSIQTIDLLTRAVAFETFLPTDGAAVVVSDVRHGSEQTRQMLVLRLAGGDPTAFAAEKIPGTSRTLMLLNMELFRGPRFRVSSHPTLHKRIPGHPYVVATLMAEPSPFLFDWMRRFSVWRRLGPWAVIVTDPSWDENAAEELRSLVSGLGAAPDVVEIEVEVVSSGAGASTPVRMSLPCLVSSACGAVMAVSGTVVKDFDVEVAQFAAVSDPLVAPTFSGLALALEVSSSGTAWIFDVRGAAQRFHDPVAAFTPRGPVMGSVDLPRYDVLSVNERQSISQKAGSAAITIGTRSAKAGRSSLSLNVSVRGQGAR